MFKLWAEKLYWAGPRLGSLFSITIGPGPCHLATRMPLPPLTVTVIRREAKFTQAGSSVTQAAGPAGPGLEGGLGSLFSATLAAE